MLQRSKIETNTIWFGLQSSPVPVWLRSRLLWIQGRRLLNYRLKSILFIGLFTTPSRRKGIILHYNLVLLKEQARPSACYWWIPSIISCKPRVLNDWTKRRRTWETIKETQIWGDIESLPSLIGKAVLENSRLLKSGLCPHGKRGTCFCGRSWSANGPDHILCCQWRRPSCQ